MPNVFLIKYDKILSPFGVHKQHNLFSLFANRSTPSSSQNLRERICGSVIVFSTHNIGNFLLFPLVLDVFLFLYQVAFLPIL